VVNYTNSKRIIYFDFCRWKYVTLQPSSHTTALQIFKFNMHFIDMHIFLRNEVSFLRFLFEMFTPILTIFLLQQSSNAHYFLYINVNTGSHEYFTSVCCIHNFTNLQYFKHIQCEGNKFVETLIKKIVVELANCNLNLVCMT